MKTLKDFLEARMIATGDFKISASGRKVRRLIKVGDDDYNKADDIDKDGDVDADDAKRKKMQGESVEHIEEATVKSQSYSWGTMKTVHHGKDFSIPLHPEHHKPIAALKHGESHSFKDETGRKWKATREHDTVHFHGGSYGTQKTSVKHDTMKESVEITEASEHLVHVSDGSKYDEKPHPKDVEHVMSGVKKHNGEFDGHSDKGVYFKFKSHDDARSFKKHVDSCPNHSCSADLHEDVEQVTEATDKQDARLLQLARLGLLDKSDIALFRTSMQTFKSDKQLSIKQRALLLTVYDELVNLVTGDDALFNRTKIDLQREETEQLDEISKSTLASYIPKAAKDARIHGQIASDFAARGKTARKPGSKEAWNNLSQKYKEKAWKRDDGITKAVTKLTKEETDLEEGKRGLWDNIHAKRERIAAGSGEKMRKPGSKGAPTAQDFKDAAKTTKEETQHEGYYKDIDTNNKETERLSGSWKVETPWRKVKSGSDTVTDKSGAKHGPMSRVRHLARLARAKSSKEGK
jgi:hypothetical protein